MKILTGYRPCSRSLYYFTSKFPSVLRGNHTRSIRTLSPKFMYHIYQKLNITALQNCLNWHLIRDMVTRPSWCCVFIVVSQTYLVAQIAVKQISLNLADEINSLKLKNFKFRGNRSIFVRTERLNTILRKFACIAKSKLQNKFQSFNWKQI